MSQYSMFFYQQFLSSITLEVKPIVLGQEDTSYWHFDNIFCRLNGYRKVIILEAIYQQSEKVQYQRKLTATVKTNIFQRQITNTRFVWCYATPSQAPLVEAMPPFANKNMCIIVSNLTLVFLHKNVPRSGRLPFKKTLLLVDTVMGFLQGFTGDNVLNTTFN